jgi:hypothetical protein
MNDKRPDITPEELYELEEKYRGFLPLATAVQIIKMINYVQKLEMENVKLKKDISAIEERVEGLNTILKQG